MSESDKVFSGSIAKVYDSYLVPLIFGGFAEDIARRVAALADRFYAKNVATNNHDDVLTSGGFHCIFVVIMFVDSSTTRLNGKAYPRHLLRESYREAGKVKHRTIANLVRI